MKFCGLARLKGSRLALALALLAATALPGLSLAQTPNATTNTGGVASGQVSEIVVTAQKRTENVQNVPVLMTVVTSDQLTAACVHNVQDLSSVAPSWV